MVFSKKARGIFVDLNDQTFSVAAASAFSAPLVVEEVRSCPADKADAVASLLEEFQPKRSAGRARSLLHAVCGVYPARRVVRRITVDAKRVGEDKYLDEAVATQCRIAPDDYLLALMSAKTGLNHDVSPSNELVAAGMPLSDISQVQSRLIDLGIYPRRLELGTVSAIGALVQYLAFAQSTTPTLILEIGDQSTESYIVADGGLAVTRQISQGIESMIPIMQKELGLKDEEAAKRLFYSNTFDFTGMASAFTKKLIKELQSSIGFYEVQTGQSIGQVLCASLPARLGWIQQSIANQLGVETLKPDLTAWLKSVGVTFASGVPAASDTSLLGLYGLISAK